MFYDFWLKNKKYIDLHTKTVHRINYLQCLKKIEMMLFYLILTSS
jgi:hypothetical protein